MIQTIGGRRPWDCSTEPSGFISTGGDKQDQINICLSCRVPQRECKGYRNCQKHINYGQKIPYYSERYSYELFEEILSESGTVRQKADKLGISWQTYYNWRNKYYAEKSAKEGK